MIPLHSKLTNDASVSDWLGTAASSARVAATKIAQIRSGEETSPTALALILQFIDSARADIVAVQSHVTNENLRTTALR